MIVPITLILTAALMILAFSLHDRVILRAVSISEVMEYADRFDEGPEQIREAVAKDLELRLIAAKEVAVNAETKEEEITLLSKGTVESPLGSIRELLGETSGQLESSISISNLQARKTLVKYKTICDGLEAVTKPSQKSEEES